MYSCQKFPHYVPSELNIIKCDYLTTIGVCFIDTVVIYVYSFE